MRGCIGLVRLDKQPMQREADEAFATLTLPRAGELPKPVPRSRSNGVAEGGTIPSRSATSSTCCWRTYRRRKHGLFVASSRTPRLLPRCLIGALCLPDEPDVEISIDIESHTAKVPSAIPTAS